MLHILQYQKELLTMNTFIYLKAITGDKDMICKGCFNCQLWGELTVLTVGIGLVFGSILLIFS